MSQLLDNSKKMTKIEREKNLEQLFLAQNCLKRIMSQLLEYTKKIDKKSRKKSRKIVYGLKLSAPNNEPTLR